MNKEFIVPTGFILKEYLEYYEINFSDLPNLLEISKTEFNDLLKGKSPLTEELSRKINIIIPDIPSSYWLNYEKQFQQYLRENDTDDINLSKEELQAISIRFKFNSIFKDLNWDIKKQAKEMLNILKIDSFSDFEEAYSSSNVEFMEDGGEKEAISIWLNLCEEEIEIQNKDLSSKEYKETTLSNSLEKFKSIALNSDCQNSLKSARKLLNRLGVYLVFLSPIENSKVRGALTTYKENPAIFLSGRFKSHDHIWFALMHEIGHLILHYEKNKALISYEDEGIFAPDISIKEIEANEFARNFFINNVQYSKFISSSIINDKSIRTFAESQNILPGIVVARLQHDGIISFEKFNHLKNK